MSPYPLFWFGIPPSNNEHAMGPLRPDQKKKMLPHHIIDTKVYILRDIWCFSRHCFNSSYDIYFFWWYHMYDLCGMFETKFPYPPRAILWHHLVIPVLLETFDCNVHILYSIGSFWICIGHIDSLALVKIELWLFPPIEPWWWWPITIEVIWYSYVLA